MDLNMGPKLFQSGFLFGAKIPIKEKKKTVAGSFFLSTRGQTSQNVNHSIRQTPDIEVQKAPPKK